MFTQNQQTLNFISFHSVYVAPLYSLLADSGNPRHFSILSPFAKAALLESIGWVSLGGAVGHFAESDALRLRVGLGGHMHTAGIDEFYRAWGHRLDSEWLRFFESAGPLRRLPFQNSDHQASMEILSEVFNSYFARWFYIARSASANDAMAVLNFARPDDLERGFQLKVDIEELAEALASERDLLQMPPGMSFGSVYAGYGELVDFLDSFQSLSERFLAIYGSRTQGITRKVAQLLRWRFFFFESRTPLFYLFLDRYLDILGVIDSASRKQFRLRVDGLAKAWAGMQASRAAEVGA